jgi:hypothetical protein
MGGIDSGATGMLIVVKVSKNQRAVGFIEDAFSITVEDSEMLPENRDSIEWIANFVTRKKG